MQLLYKCNVKDATNTFLFPIEGQRITEKKTDKRVKTYKIENKRSFIYYGIKDICEK